MKRWGEDASVAGLLFVQHNHKCSVQLNEKSRWKVWWRSHDGEMFKNLTDG